MTEPAPGPAPEPAAPQLVGPHPLPMTVQCDVVQGNDGTHMVVVVFHTGAGQGVYFLTPQQAQEFGGTVRALGKQAASGLWTPGAGPVPDVSGNGKHPWAP